MARHLRASLEAQVVILNAFLSKPPARLSVEGVHELRIAVRRIRAVLWLLGRSFPAADFAKVDKHLRKFGKRLGVIRELDVAMKDAKKYKLAASGLESKRKREAHVLLGYMNERRRDRLGGELAGVLRRLGSADELNLKNAMREARERLDHWHTRRLRAGPRLHRFRIALKKTRYILEAVGQPVDSLTDIQQVLGKAHDLETLRHLVGSTRKLKTKEHEFADRAVQLAAPVLDSVGRRLERI